ncbi:DUF2262 domain-containing protein [Bremerella cremea]|uniref:DUF2262 domain-containing protein n=1 Tax=Bremerella cremea TaxID=1031537 RepID=UPI0031E9D3C6
MDTMMTVEGHEIRVMEGPYVEAGKATPAATEFGRKLIGMLPAMKKAATDSLLETYNDSWADEEEGFPELDASQFEANLVSPKIVIFDDLNAASVFFEDSDMFGGHSIDVTIYEGKIKGATLVG